MESGRFAMRDHIVVYGTWVSVRPNHFSLIKCMVVCAGEKWISFKLILYGFLRVQIMDYIINHLYAYHEVGLCEPTCGPIRMEETLMRIFWKKTP